MSEITVSILQINAQDDDKARTIEKVLAMLDLAAGRGSTLAVLPEVWVGTGFSSRDAYRDLAEPIPGPVTQLLCRKAAETRMTIFGSIYEAGPDGLFYNSAPVIGPDGTIEGVYRKTHLFDAPGRSDMPSMLESEKVRSGSELQVYDAPFGRFGVGICFDLRFPEIFRDYAASGAKLIVMSTAFLAPRFDHWEFLMRARATDNQVFMIGSGMVGHERVSGIGFVGRSMVVDPWGVVTAQASDREMVLTTTIDLDQVSSIRSGFPLHAQRRPSIYDRPTCIPFSGGSRLQDPGFLRVDVTEPAL